MKPFKNYFYQHVKKEFPSDFHFIIQETDYHFDVISTDIQFIKTSGNPIDKRLEFCAYFLALIKALDARHIKFEEIRTLCLAITIDYVQPQNKLQSYSKKLIPRLTNTFIGNFIIKKFAKKVGKNASSEGWFFATCSGKRIFTA